MCFYKQLLSQEGFRGSSKLSYICPISRSDLRTYVRISERGHPKGVMKLPGRDGMGGWPRTDLFAFLPGGSRAVTYPTRDPPADLPKTHDF